MFNRLQKAAVAAPVMIAGMAAPVFAASVVTAEQLAPITTSFTDTVAVVLPVGLGIFAGLVGIGFIRKIFRKVA